MFMDPPPVESAADVSTGSRTKVELTVLISSLREGDADALPGCESDLKETNETFGELKIAGAWYTSIVRQLGQLHFRRLY
jgi:hypothetical protein